ncbi:hypothetical protein ANN_24746 [Periplaneta americana]|uniref:Uncharacterized protein n=1 Tax=Periplaneta americana TaxID=6978 RepID=A0ABQ8RZR6_PERAM|nr:hypothetical protein ANN_24746 [Periplaneta americana]
MVGLCQGDNEPPGSLKALINVEMECTGASGFRATKVWALESKPNIARRLRVGDDILRLCPCLTTVPTKPSPLPLTIQILSFLTSFHIPSGLLT